MQSLEKISRHIGVACIACLLILITTQVVLRYGFNYTHVLTEEFGRYLLVWATLAGMAIECRHGGHIKVDFLIAGLPSTVRRLWLIFLDIICLILFLLVLYTGIDSTIFNHGQESGGLQIPLSLPFSAIPLFFAVAALFAAEKIWRQLRER